MVAGAPVPHWSGASWPWPRPATLVGQFSPAKPPCRHHRSIRPPRVLPRVHSSPLQDSALCPRHGALPWGREDSGSMPMARELSSTTPVIPHIERRSWQKSFWTAALLATPKASSALENEQPGAALYHSRSAHSPHHTIKTRVFCSGRHQNGGVGGVVQFSRLLWHRQPGPGHMPGGPRMSPTILNLRPPKSKSYHAVSPLIIRKCIHLRDARSCKFEFGQHIPSVARPSSTRSLTQCAAAVSECKCTQNSCILCWAWACCKPDWTGRVVVTHPSDPTQHRSPVWRCHCFSADSRNCIYNESMHYAL